MKNFFLKIITLFLLLALTNFLFLQSYGSTLLKGNVSSFNTKGKKINLKLNTTLVPHYSLTGDKINAFISEDINLNEGFTIPKGSKLEGIIVSINEPKRMGIDGSIDIEFNKLIFPDMTSIPIFASASTDKRENLEKVASILTYDTALITYGLLNGAVGGLQYGGIPLAITSHGISVLAGAGIGTGAGIFGSFFRKGNMPTITSLNSYEIVLHSDLFVFGDKIPDVENIEEAINNEGGYKGFRFNKPINNEEVEINIKKISKERKEKFGNFIVVDCNIKNNSNQNFSLGNLVLINHLDNSITYPDIFLTGNELLKTIKSEESLDIKISYIPSTNRIENYHLVLIDTLDSHKIVSIPLK